MAAPQVPPQAFSILRLDNVGNIIWWKAYRTFAGFNAIHNTGGKIFSGYSCRNSSSSSNPIWVIGALNDSANLRAIHTCYENINSKSYYQNIMLAKISVDGTPVWLRDYGDPSGVDNFVTLNEYCSELGWSIAFNGTGHYPEGDPLNDCDLYLIGSKYAHTLGPPAEPGAATPPNVPKHQGWIIRTQVHDVGVNSVLSSSIGGTEDDHFVASTFNTVTPDIFAGGHSNSYGAASQPTNDMFTVHPNLSIAGLACDHYPIVPCVNSCSIESQTIEAATCDELIERFPCRPSGWSHLKDGNTAQYIGDENLACTSILCSGIWNCDSRPATTAPCTNP